MHAHFEWLSRTTARFVGSPSAFLASVLVVILWAATGPFFGWSDTHQLIINTTTTIITFWIVFLIQGSQNHDTAEIRAMLIELVKKLPETDTALAERVESEED